MARIGETMKVYKKSRSLLCNIIFYYFFAVITMIFTHAIEAGDVVINQTSEDSFTMCVESPRPVAAMVKAIQEKYNQIITYEDPPYSHLNDLTVKKWVTTTDPRTNAVIKIPKLATPRFSKLEVSFTESSFTDKNNSYEMVKKIIEEHDARANPGRFKLIRQGEMLHVIPVLVTDSSGKLMKITPLLSSSMSLVKKERTVLEAFEIFCETLDSLTESKVVMGTIPLSLMKSSHSAIGAENEPARDVLVKILSGVDTPLSWRLLYDPGLKWYALNINILSIE